VHVIAVVPACLRPIASRHDSCTIAARHPMQQAILTSVMLATFAIPVLIARRREGGSYGAVLVATLAFVAVYVVLLIVVYPRLF
jgi:hypothetical protein